MSKNWKELAAEQFIFLLSCIPQSVYNGLSLISGALLDQKKGHIARAAINLALPGTTSQDIHHIAKTSARHSLAYMLSLPRLNQVNYQLHDRDIVEKAVAQDQGVIVISLHTGPPDLGTLALTQAGIQAKTVIGAGKQSPWLNSLGRFALKRAGIEFIQKGNPTAVLQAIKKKHTVFLYSDMRSKEVPITFFGQATSAPGSGIYTASLTKSPILFHYCTLVDGQWQLFFESFEIEKKENRKASVEHNLQRLMHKMESVIREYPELWIWHYDRFKLKEKINKK